MGIEAGTNISNLNISWPLDTDPTHEGNDHLQVVKNVIQKTFAGRDGNGDPEGGYAIPVTAKAEELNMLEDLTGNVQDQLDLKALKEYIDKETGPDRIVIGEDGTDTHIKTTDDSSLHQSWNDGANTATILNTTNMFEFVFKLMYPIGMVLFSVDNVNPGVRLIGTTWTSVADGRFIASVGNFTDGEGTTRNWSAGDVGEGEYKHDLTVSEMPSHNHDYEGATYNTSATGTSYIQDGSSKDANRTNDAIRNTGGGSSHNNVPPGFALYVWQRTA